jgi:hypothetical protein
VKHENFITEYCQILDQSHGQRPDLLWFSTWMASKSPYFNFAKKFEFFWKSGNFDSRFPLIKKWKMTLRLTASLVLLLAKCLFLKWTYRNELKALEKLNKINVLRTFLYSPESQARDPFWGDFVTELEKSEIPLVVVFEPQFSIFKCKKTFHPLRRNFPYQVFISPWKLLGNYINLVEEAYGKWSFQNKNNSYFVKNQNISTLVTSHYREELLSPSALTTLGFYDCFYKIMSDFEIQNFYLTFENNPWEKMCYLARRELQKKFNVIGFQHTAVQRGAANYFLSDYEIRYQLHPDLVICAGEKQLEVLRSYPTYKSVKTTLGCALRHSFLGEKTDESINASHLKPAEFKILVALDGVPDTIELLQLALQFSELFKEDSLEIRIKEHPNFSIEKAYPQVLNHPEIKNNRVKLSTNSLEENLNWCNYLLYSGTVVSIEALRKGKMLIQFGYTLFDYDPLFQYQETKINIKNVDEMVRALIEIKNLHPADQMSRGLKAGQSFAESYFYPCTQESIKTFLETSI